MKKKRYKFLIITGVLYLLGYMMVKIKDKIQQETVISQKIAILSSPLTSYKDKIENKNNAPSVFVAFHPDCEHCQYEAKSINERHIDLQYTNIVLFTSANDSLTKAFSHTYGLDTLKNVQVMTDETNEIHQRFGVKMIPTIFIYDSRGNLLKQYKGETKIEAILKTLSL
jgi:thioredoxin-related protein